MPLGKKLLFSADIPLANNITTCLVEVGYKAVQWHRGNRTNPSGETGACDPG
jgi:hypothetical protein